LAECQASKEQCGFRCTGYSGEEIWKKIHAIPKEIECEECADHTEKILNGVHDLVNAGLGKQTFDKKNFNQFADEVQCVRDICRADGRC